MEISFLNIKEISYHYFITKSSINSNRLSLRGFGVLGCLVRPVTRGLAVSGASILGESQWRQGFSVFIARGVRCFWLRCSVFYGIWRPSHFEGSVFAPKTGPPDKAQTKPKTPKPQNPVC